MQKLKLIGIALFFLTCKERAPNSTIKSDAGRLQPRLTASPDIPPNGRSLFDLALHRIENPAGRDRVPFPFERLDAYLGSVTSRDRDPNGEMKKTSSVLIPVGRSIQRFAAEPDFFRFPRIILSPTSWYDMSSGIPISLESKLFVAYAPLANQLEVISYNEDMGRYEFQVVEDYREGQLPRVRYADRSLCTSCHQNQGPIFSSEPWHETNFNIQVASLISAATDKETYYGVPVRQTEADTDSGANDSFALNIRIDNASDIIAMNNIWMAVTPAFVGDPISYRAKLLRTMLLDSLQIESAKSQEIDELNQLIAKVYPQGFPLTDGIFATRFPLGSLSTTPAGMSALERIGVKDASFLFDGTPNSNRLLGTLTEAIQSDLRTLPPVGQSLGAPRVNDTGKTEPTEVFDGAAFFGSFRSVFRTYGLEAVRNILKINRSNGVSRISELISAMEKLARSSQKGVIAGAEPLNLSRLLRDLRLASGLPAPTSTWIDAKNLPTALGPESTSGLTRDRVQDEHLRRFFSVCDSCHRNTREGVPAFLAGSTESEVLKGILKYKKEILNRMNRKDDSAMPPPGTSEAAMLERFPAERLYLLQWIERLGH